MPLHTTKCLFGGIFLCQKNGITGIYKENPIDMNNILSYGAYIESQVSEGTAILKWEEGNLILALEGVTKSIAIADADSERGLFDQMREALHEMGASGIHVASPLDEEFGKMIMSPGTSGEVDPKKGWISNTLSKLFRRQTSHKSIFSMILGDAEDKYNKIRN